MMKKSIILILIFVSIFNIFLFSQNLQQQKPSYEEGREAGRLAASSENSFIWGLVGCGATCFFEGLGCLGATLAGYLIEPTVPYVSSEKGDDYIRGFRESFASEVKKKRATSAFVGGCLSTIGQIIIYIPVYIIYGAWITATLASIFSMQ